jgi:hypothetical protein
VGRGRIFKTWSYVRCSQDLNYFLYCSVLNIGTKKECKALLLIVLFIVVAVFGVVAAFLASAGKQQFAVVNGCPKTGEQ